MDRDSEAETVLADEEWLDTSADNAQRHRNRRPERVSATSRNVDVFDEEELFSSSGSLSSLHEFSDGDGDSVLSDDSAADENNGPIIRNGATQPANIDQNSGIASHAAAAVATDIAASSSAIHTESEVDVDGDDFRSLLLQKSGKGRSARSSSPLSSPSTWQKHRGRKVIADDDDESDDDGDSDDDADTEDIPSDKERRRKSSAEAGLRRNQLGVSHHGTSERTLSVSGDSEASGTKPVDPAHHKHKSSKRRRPRYEEPDLVDDSGCPQLVYFASKGDVVACKKLLLHGASVGATDSRGWTALHEATKNRHTDVLELLLNPPTRARQLSEAELGSEGSSVFDPSESRIVRQLRSPFPNVNMTTAHSRLTPLHQAVMNDDMRAVRLLLDNGATGQTKLHRACNAGDLEQTVSLINQGADINMKDNAGWTPLHESALEGHNAVVVALLRRGAEYGAKGFGGDTPLHDACANGHYDVVRSLLVAGADPQLKNSKGVTPEDMAREEEQEEVMELIKQHRRALVHEATREPTYGKVKGGSGSKGKASVGELSRATSRASDRSPRSESNTGDIDVGPSVSNGKSSGNTAEILPAQLKHSSKKGKTDSVRDRHGVSGQQRRPSSSSQAGSTAQKRELAALRLLREEAEKPTVNYYFSSNSSKLSRDERKLQNLMGTFERLEKRKPKEKQRQAWGDMTNACDITMTLDTLKTPPLSGRSANTTSRQWDGGAAGGEDGVDDADEIRSQDSRQSSNMSPKRVRSRQSIKRAVNDEDDDADSHRASLQQRAGLRQAGSKRPRQKAEPMGRVVEEDTADLSRRRDVPIAADNASGSVKRTSKANISTDGSAESSAAIRTVTSTVEIKGEEPAGSYPAGASRQQHQQKQQQHSRDPVTVVAPVPIAGGTASMLSSRPRSSNSHRDKPSKHRSVGGRTIVENPSPVNSRYSGNMTPTSMAAQAIRFLPLYTIQLHCDPPTSKLDYFVVDLQIRLLLGMPVETPSEPYTDDKPETNPLFEAYPHLCRQRITEPQKEHLWEPLAGMFVSNMQFIHGATVAKAGEDQHRDKSSLKAATATDDSASADCEIVSQFTLHERKRFVGLSLYFVKLDEIVELIRRDYPQISKQLITITLDLSDISIAADITLSSPRRQLPHPIIEAADQEEGQKACPTWRGPQKMVPLRYALKLHYRDVVKSNETTKE
ncbi:hypothetical protein GGI15_004927 [Coemansia interrupta]|uniref:Uncharacterized protein n=1 Tax=Coemansia interrupta TaxID=1126814 RepID=A0A9W8H0R6_9FUNG|nr:hypothetical protein GGI15_004927 [Coemansia interrupta]